MKGNEPLTRAAFEEICRTLISEEKNPNTHIFVLLYTMLLLYLFSRSDSVAALCTTAFRWDNDHMVITLHGHKGDRAGKQNGDKACYSYPATPYLDIVFVLGLYLLISPSCERQLFTGNVETKEVYEKYKKWWATQFKGYKDGLVHDSDIDVISSNNNNDEELLSYFQGMLELDGDSEDETSDDTDADSMNTNNSSSNFTNTINSCSCRMTATGLTDLAKNFL